MTSRTSTPISAGRSSRPSRVRGARGGGRAHSASSPVSSTNRSSRFAGRRSPSGMCAVRALDAEHAHRRAGAARVVARRARLGLGLGEPRRRPVDLDRLAADVLGDELRRRAGRDRAALGHDHDGVGEALGLLDVVRRHQDRDALGAQRVDQRPQLLAHLGIEPDGRLVEQHEPRTVHERPRDQQPPPHAARQLVGARVAAVAQPRHLERALDRVLALAARDPVEVREDAQVLLDRQRRVEVVELRARRPSPRAPPWSRRGACGRAPGSRPRRRSPAPSAAASSSTCPRRWARAGRRRCPRAPRGRGGRRR